MLIETPAPVRLEDYTPPSFTVEAVRLDVDIRDGETMGGAWRPGSIA